MKRALAMILTACMTISLLAGCGGTASDGSSTSGGSIASSSVGAETNHTPIELKLATSYAEGSDYINTMEATCADIEAKTDGLIKITVYPGNQLGSTMDCVEMALNGANVIAGLGFANLSTYVKEAAIPGYPYACGDFDEMINLTNSDWWAGIKQELKDQWNIVPIMYLSCGYRNMIGSVPVRCADDLAPVITRIGLGTIGQEFVAACGGTPTTTSTFADCYSALQTKMFELCEGDCELLYNTALYEVADYLSVTRHMMNPAMFFVTNDIWEQIPEEYQTLLLDEFQSAARTIWDTYSSKEEAWIQKFADAGVTVVPFEEIDVDSFKATIPAIMAAEGIDESTYNDFLEALKG